MALISHNSDGSYAEEDHTVSDMAPLGFDEFNLCLVGVAYILAVLFFIMLPTLIYIYTN